MAVDGQHCPWHSTAPEWVAKRQQWSAKGGSSRSNASRARKRLPAESMSVPELYGVVSKALRDVVAGDLDKGVGTAVSSLARTLVGIWQQVELSQRMDDLQEQIAQLKGKERA